MFQKHVLSIATCALTAVTLIIPKKIHMETEPDVKCANCTEAHNSFSRFCPTYKKEFEIQKIKVTQKKTISEARKEYAIQNPLPMTYAKILKTCNCVCKCQQQNKAGTSSTPSTSAKTSPSKQNTKPTTNASQSNSKALTITKKDGSSFKLLPSSTSKRKLRQLAQENKKLKNKTTSPSASEDSDESMTCKTNLNNTDSESNYG
ncbi:hypothetical protein ACFFRR_001296 [Megaselia abdita]